MNKAQISKLKQERNKLVEKVLEINNKLRPNMIRLNLKEALGRVYEIKTERKGNGVISCKIYVPLSLIGMKVRLVLIKDGTEVKTNGK